MEGSTGRQRVPDDAFKKRLIVPVPSPEEQSAIARILDAVDTAIERTQDAVDRARDLQTSLTSELIDKLGAPLRRLAEFATDVRYGTSNASNTNGWGHPALRIPNVLRGELSVDDLSYVEVKAADSQRLMLRDGDLLLVRTNGNPHYVGRSVVFHPPDGRHWIYASYLIRVRLGEGLSPEYANLVLGLERGRRELLRRVTTSAGNCNINSNSIRLVRLPVPRLESDQKRVVEAAHAVRAVQEAHLVELSALHDLKRALMHDLLTGKVCTDQLALDEVAA
jgi:type I restriction enzyme S subunit